MSRRRKDPWETWWGRVRSVVLFAVGLVMFVLEARKGAAAEWFLLAAYLGMLGVPMWWLADVSRNSRKPDGPDADE